MLGLPTHGTHLTEISLFYCTYHLFTLGSYSAHRNGNYCSGGMVFKGWILLEAAVISSYRGNFHLQAIYLMLNGIG